MMNINLTYSCNRNCSYCFAKGFLEKWPQEISLEGLESVFRWATKQKIKKVSFSGGELTLFSKINSALELAEEYGLKIVPSINGTTNIERINIDSPAIDFFLVSLNPPSEYSFQELKTLYSNLKTIRRVKRVVLRFNITSLDVSYSYLIDTCERLNIRRIDFALIFPSIFGQNKYIKKRELKDFSPYILQLARDLLKHNILGVFSEPFPLCFFSEKEKEFLVKNNNLHGVCSTGKGCVITPNLTILPCSALAIEGPSLETFKNKKEIFDYYKKVIDRLKWEIDLFPQCKDCIFKKNKQCQGGCLIYKFLQIGDSIKLTDRDFKLPSKD